jgi:RNA polymerase sigma factor (sigma-70 family)
MDAKAAEDPKLLAHFEGLVRKTAGRYQPRLEEDYDDICQFLRYKVWKALLSVDPEQLRTRALTSQYTALQLRDRYVFSCIANAVKDLLKRKRHNLLFIEDMTATRFEHYEGGNGTTAARDQRDAFDERYLREDDAFTKVDDDVLIPSTLTRDEREILLLMYLDYKPAEIAAQKAVPRKEVSAAMKTIREKMADWSPSGNQAVPIAA